jgi:multidrug resistance efflux pump
MLKRVLAIIIVAALLVAGLLFSQYRREPLKVSGFIEADEIRVGSRVGGRVQKVSAVEGQQVKVGDPLIELEPYDLLDRRAEAAAQLSSKQAELRRLESGFRAEDIAQAKARRDALAADLARLQAGPRPQEIAAAQARLDQALAQQQLAQLTYNRVKPVFDRGAASAEEMDAASETLRAAQAQASARQQELELLKAGTRKEEIDEAQAKLAEADAALALMQAGYRKEEVEQARAAVEAADAAVKALDRQLAELKITAPVAGTVEAVELQPGDLVSANAPILSLIDNSNLWVRAYVPEKHLNLQTDQKVRVTVDSFPGREFPAHISFIAKQAEFTPGNVQTPEERSKQVFRIKATLDGNLDLLRPGMSADVWLN